MAPNHLLYLAGGVVPSGVRTAGSRDACGLQAGSGADLDELPPGPPGAHRHRVVEPDPKYPGRANRCLIPAFHAELMAGRQSLIEKGVEPADPRPMVPDMRRHGQTMSEVPM